MKTDPKTLIERIHERIAYYKERSVEIKAVVVNGSDLEAIAEYLKRKHGQRYKGMPLRVEIDRCPLRVNPFLERGKFELELGGIGGKP